MCPSFLALILRILLLLALILMPTVLVTLNFVHRMLAPYVQTNGHSVGISSSCSFTYIPDLAVAFPPLSGVGDSMGDVINRLLATFTPRKFPGTHFKPG